MLTAYEKEFMIPLDNEILTDKESSILMARLKT